MPPTQAGVRCWAPSPWPGYRWVGGGTYSESVGCLVSWQEPLVDIVRRWLQKKNLAKQAPAASLEQCW